MFGTKNYKPRFFFEGEGNGGGANPPPASPPPAAPPAPAPTDFSWDTHIQDEATRGWLKAKGVKDPATLASSYRELEKFVGVPKEQLLKLPENLDSPEAEAIFRRLGKPAKAEDYKLDGEMKDFAEQFHKANLSTKQAEALVKAYTERATNQAKAAQEAAQTALNNEVEALKKTWGNAHDQKMQLAAHAAQKFGLGAEGLSAIQKAMGYTKGAEFLATLGEKMGEAKFIQGNGGSTKLDTDTAKSKISEKMADPAFMKRYASGDKAAIAEMMRLGEDAYPGELKF